MKALAGLAAAGTVALLAGCGTSAPPSSGGTTPAAAHTSAPTCKQVYDAWKTGPAKAIADGPLKTALAQVQSAASSSDLLLLRTALEAVGAAAVKLEAYPMPACADPAGYYAQFLSLLRASGDNAKTASGLGGLILAEVPLKQVPAVEAKLTAELKKDAEAS